MRGSISPEAWVVALAYLKAESTRRALDTNLLEKTVVLGADTVVVKEGEVIGQPRDQKEALAIIQRLMDGSHVVLTGVALLVPGLPRELFTDAAHVRVGSIDDHAVAAYIESGDWTGKAGAYNLEERLAAWWPIEFEGDPSTIMGLPMRALAPRLRTALGSLHAAAEPAR